jgi:hypothetical protein
MDNVSASELILFLKNTHGIFYLPVQVPDGMMAVPVPRVTIINILQANQGLSPWRVDHMDYNPRGQVSRTWLVPNT